MNTRIYAVTGFTITLALVCGCQSGPSLIEQYANRDWALGDTNPTNTAEAIQGEWRFVYTYKSLIMFGQDFSCPPSFDTIEFKTNGTIRLVDSMMRREFAGDYTLAGNKLEWTFSPVDVKTPVEHRLECSWIDKGRALVLHMASDTETAWVYYRPSRLLPVDTITGKWVATIEGEKGDMTFEADGRYYTNDKNVWGYYRLWSSRYGNTLTTPIWIQEEGGFIVQYLYTIDSDRLTLTPLTWKGPEKKGLMVWTRMKEEKPPNRVPENLGTNAPTFQH